MKNNFYILSGDFFLPSMPSLMGYKYLVQYRRSMKTWWMWIHSSTYILIILFQFYIITLLFIINKHLKCIFCLTCHITIVVTGTSICSCFYGNGMLYSLCFGGRANGRCRRDCWGGLRGGYLGCTLILRLWNGGMSATSWTNDGEWYRLLKTFDNCTVFLSFPS